MPASHNWAEMLFWRHLNVTKTPVWLKVQNQRSRSQHGENLAIYFGSLLPIWCTLEYWVWYTKVWNKHIKLTCRQNHPIGIKFYLVSYFILGLHTFVTWSPGNINFCMCITFGDLQSSTARNYKLSLEKRIYIYCISIPSHNSNTDLHLWLLIKQLPLRVLNELCAGGPTVPYWY